MRILLITIISCLVTIGSVGTSLSADSDASQKPSLSLSEQLRDAYSRFSDANKNGDISSWKKYLSTHAYLEMKNLTVSTDEKLDGAYLKEFSSMVPPLEGLKELAVRQNKDTAKLILFGKPSNAQDSENMHIVPSFWVIDFLRENGIWKVDRVGGKLPSEIPGAEEKIAKGDFSSILTDASFYPDGEIPALPKEVTAIDLQGRLNVWTGGYKTKIWINGYDQNPDEPFADTSSICPVIGGLKFGTNVIKIVVEKINGRSSFGDNAPDYKVIVAGCKNSNEIHQVFAYTPAGKPISNEATFVVGKNDF